MCMILDMPPHHHHSGYHEPVWRDSHSDILRTQTEQGKIALPPIRQTFPDFDQRRPPSAISRTGTRASSGYHLSPNALKRDRLSLDREKETNRGRWVPSPLEAHEQARSRPQSPAPQSHLTHRPWADVDHSRSYANRDSFLSGRSPDTRKVYEQAEPRPILPGLPPLNFDRGTNESIRVQGHAGDDYMLDPSRRPSLVPTNERCADVGGHGYQLPTYGYGYSHLNRVQSLPISPAFLDRTPFSPGAYGPHFQETFMRIGDMGLGTNGDGKQRKRRGNLPKETTDKLRSWFVAHLHHPYPSEDEKQELIRQTGLQMNQISNWFINARRRQLPAMITNAQIEKKAMNGRAADSKVLSPSERIDYDNDGKHRSDSEASDYEDIEIESAKRHRTTHWKRESV